MQFSRPTIRLRVRSSLLHYLASRSFYRSTCMIHGKLAHFFRSTHIFIFFFIKKNLTHKSMKNLQSTENISPCNPLARILVFSPLPNSPFSPSIAMTARAAAVYPMRVSLTWRNVLTTRREFEIVSETTEATNPMRARRPSVWRVVCGGGRRPSRKLYVPNHW